MKIVTFTAMAAILMAFGQAASAKRELLSLEPAASWVMDYADDSCALRRSFKSGEKFAQLELRQFAPNDSIQITVASNSWVRVHRSIEYRFEPHQEWRKSDRSMYARFGKDVEAVVLNVDISPNEEERTDEDSEMGLIDREAAALRAAAFKQFTRFSITDAFRENFTFNTGSMVAPYDAMQTCLDELVTHWGIDAEAHRSLTRMAVPKDINVIVRRLQRDYPPAMLVKGMPGLLQMRLSVSDQGAVTGCHIQLDISDPEFERTACENVNAAKFHPALNKDGRPIASYWRTRIVYSIN